MREPDPPGISKQSWIDLIREHPNLVPPEPLEGINPFTMKPMVLRPHLDAARLVIDGEEVGTMSWAMDDSNLILVFGEVQVVVPLARQIAESLGGRFKEVASDEQR